MTTKTTWHGTQAEALALLGVITRNCTCEFGLMGVRLSTCGVHEMLTNDQRALNGLLFSRRMVGRLLAEEFLTTAKGAIEA